MKKGKPNEIEQSLDISENDTNDRVRPSLVEVCIIYYFFVTIKTNI